MTTRFQNAMNFDHDLFCLLTQLLSFLQRMRRSVHSPVREVITKACKFSEAREVSSHRSRVPPLARVGEFRQLRRSHKVVVEPHQFVVQSGELSFVQKLLQPTALTKVPDNVVEARFHVQPGK